MIPLMKLLPLEPSDRALIRSLVISEWGDDFVIVHDSVFNPHLLPGFKLVDTNDLAGFVTYDIQKNTCEIVTLNSFRERQGIGSALLAAVEKYARQKGCTCCMLVTTNDNLNALGFYQKRGYEVTGVATGAVDEARKRKPSIPMMAENGIPIRDEITLKKSIGDVCRSEKTESAIKLG